MAVVAGLTGLVSKQKSLTDPSAIVTGNVIAVAIIVTTAIAALPPLHTKRRRGPMLVRIHMTSHAGHTD